MAERVSADSPVRNAATRSGEAIFSEAGFLEGPAAPSVFAIVRSGLDFFRQLERAGIDLAARPPRQFDGMGHRILDAVARKLRPQEVVEIGLGHHKRIGAG